MWEPGASQPRVPSNPRRSAPLALVGVWRGRARRAERLTTRATQCRAAPGSAHSENKKPRTLDDVHGTGNLTRGHGSFVCLWGAPGDEEVELLHLKPPAERVGPMVVGVDRATGRSSVLLHGGLPSGPKEERKRRVRSYFLEAGGPGTTFTTADLVEAELGSERTLKGALPTYDFLESLAEPGKPTAWTYAAPLASEVA